MRHALVKRLLLLTALAISATDASASRPDDLRDDGSVVVGCSGLDWALEHQDDFPFAFLRDGVKQFGIAGKFGVDGDKSIWTVVADKNGRQLPVELRLSLPEGRTVPGGIAMFIGGPRIRQVGTDVTVVWAPVDKQSTGLMALTDQVVQDVGCTAAAVVSDQPYEAASLHVGPTPDRVRAAFRGWKDRPQDDIVFRIMPLVIEHSTAAPWNALAASPEAPTTALRLNVEAKPSEILGLLNPAPPKDVLSGIDRVLLHPGTEVGLWPTETDEQEVAAVVPVRRPRTVMWWPGTLARQLSRKGQSVERRGRVVGIPLDDDATRRLWITSRRGRLILGTNPDRVESMRKLEGTPWFPRDTTVGPMESSHAPGLVIQTHDPMPVIAGAVYGKDGLLYADVIMAPGAELPGLSTAPAAPEKTAKPDQGATAPEAP